MAIGLWASASFLAMVCRDSLRSWLDHLAQSNHLESQSSWIPIILNDPTKKVKMFTFFKKLFAFLLSSTEAPHSGFFDRKLWDGTEQLLQMSARPWSVIAVDSLAWTLWIWKKRISGFVLYNCNSIVLYNCNYNCILIVCNNWNKKGVLMKNNLWKAASTTLF